MARIRTLKPEFWIDEKLALMPPLTRLVFLGIISQADDAGRLVDNVKLIDGLLFPYTDDTSAEALADLHRIGRILRYRSESGQPLIQVVNWDKHQKVAHPSAYVLPAPPSNDERSSCESHEDLMKVSCSDPRPTTDIPTTDEQPRESEPEPTDDGQRAACEEFVKSRGYGGKEMLIAQGEDATAWNDSTGARVPWKDRLRLLRLAHARVEDKSSANLRSALRYVIPQQYHPFVAPLPEDRPPPARASPTHPAPTPAVVQPSVREIVAKQEAEADRYTSWRQRMLFRLRSEPDDVREALEREAAAILGEMALRSLPESARPRTIEAKALAIYGDRIGEPQPAAA